MSFCKRLLSILSVVFFVITVVGGPVIAPVYAQEPSIVGKAGVLIDARSGQVLYAKNPDLRLPPASTTKILTVAIALEEGNLNDKVTVSKNAVTQEGSSIYLTAGETLTLEDLLYGVLLSSGNDAAVAVAEHIAGSVTAFVELMNKKAQEWGAINSNFCNPNGLPNDEHYTTARDLAMIAKHAMELPLFREIAATKVKKIKRADPASFFRLINHNKLLWRYEGANGIKTGYTRVAQQCLVSSAKRGDQEFIAVVLGSVGNNIWNDSMALLDYGFKNFRTTKLVEKGKFIQEISVKEGTGKVRVVTEKEQYFTGKLGDMEVPKAKTTILKGLAAPIKKGQKVGYITYTVGDKEIGRVYLVAANAVDKKVMVKRHPWILPVAGITLCLGFVITWNRKRALRRYRKGFNRFYRGPIR